MALASELMVALVLLTKRYLNQASVVSVVVVVVFAIAY
jgi:hypothetical protein